MLEIVLQRIRLSQQLEHVFHDPAPCGEVRKRVNWRRPAARCHRTVMALIAAQIDQYGSQPGFLSFNTVRHGLWRPGGTQERLLDEVKGVVCAGRESSREAVEALVMEIEQRGGTFRRLLRGGRREGARDR